MEDLIYSAFDKLEGVDSLIAIFILSILLVITIPIKKLSEQGKMTTIKYLIIGLCLSIINSGILRIVDIYSQTKGFK